MKKKHRNTLPLAACSGFALALTATLHAQTAWDGGGGSTDYSNNLNWATDIIPGNGNNNGASIGNSSTQTVIYNTATSYTSTGTGGGNRLIVGSGTSGNGSLTLSGSAGTLTFGGDAYGSAALIGTSDTNTNVYGTVTVSAGKLAITGGTDASINLGVQYASGTSGVKSGTLTINGGTVEVGRRILMGANSNSAVGLLTISSGTLDMRRTGSGSEGDLGMIRLGAGTNTVNLDGGTVIFSGFRVSEASNARSTIYMNGATLRANATIGDLFSNGGTSNANFRIKDGGLILDTNNFAVTINDNLTQEAGHTAILRKEGAGTLTLTATSNHTGNTDVNGGNLTLQQSGGTAITQTWGGLRNQLADGTLTSSRTGTANLSTTFTSYSRAVGATGNIVSTGGTNGTNNSVIINGAAGFINAGLFFNGSEYAARSATDGFVRALAYGTDASTSSVNTIGGSTHVKLTASPGSNQDSTTLLSLNLQGGGVNWTNNSGQTLTTLGILKSGGGSQSTISGGNVTGGTDTELVIRTDISSDLLAISSILSQGAGALTKTGAGTLTLSGANTFTGQTHINAGILSIGANVNLGDEATGATLNLKGGTLQATGTFGLFNGTAGTNNRAVTLAGQSTIDVTGSNTLTIAGVISNNAGTVTAPGFTKTGTGTLVLSGVNTYTGTTILQTGSLTIGTTGVLGSGGGTAITVNGGTLTNNSTVATTGGITGTSSLTVASGAKAILANANNFSGATNVTGTLQLGNAGSMGTSTMTMASSGTLELRNDADTIFTAPINTASTTGVTYNIDVNRATVAGSNRKLSLGNITFAISGTGSITNTINVTGGNGYTLGLGTISAPSSAGSAHPVVINATTAAVEITKFAAGSYGHVLQLQGGNSITLSNYEMNNNGNNSLTVSGSGTVVTLGTTSSLSRNNGTMSYTLNSGTLNLTTTTSLANVFASGTAIAPTFAINGGTLNNTNGSALTLAANSGVTFGSPAITIGGSFAFGTALSTSANNLNLGNGAITNAGNRTITFNGTGTTLTMGGTMTNTSGTNQTTTVNGAGNTLVLGGYALGSTFTHVINGTANVNITGAVSGTGGLTYGGNATLTLAGTNSYTGKTIVQNGTISFSAGNASATADQQLGKNADLDLGVASTSSGRLLYTGAAGTLAKNMNALGNGTDTIENGGSGLLTLAGTLTKNGTTLTLKGGTNGITVSGTGTIAGSSANSDLIVDGGTVNLNTANTYNGPTFVINGATLNANATNALPTASGRSAIRMDETGTGSSTLAMTVSQTISSLGGASTSAVNLNANTLTIGTTSGSTTFAGVISGSGGSLIKDGASTQTLTGANGYTGATAVNAGMLLINGDNSAATGAVTVATGATLGGDGTVGGNTTIESGGFHSPGNGVDPAGTQFFAGNLTYNSGSTFRWNIVTDSNTYDAVDGAAGKTLSVGTGSGAIFQINSSTAYTDAFWNSPQSWNDIFSGFGTSADWDDIFTTISGDGLTWDGTKAVASTVGYFTLSGSSLNWTAIPEPTTALAGLLLTAGMLRRRRRSVE